MKCRLIVESEVVEAMAPAELVAQCVRRGKQLFAPVGTIIDAPECWRLVLMGTAESADDECAARTTQTPEQRAATLHAAARLAAHIAPEDFARYDRGEIVGYDANGNDIPGPNWVEPQQDEDDDE